MTSTEVGEAAMEETRNRRSRLARRARLARSMLEAGGKRWSGGGLWWLLGGKLEVLAFLSFLMLWNLRELECLW